MITFECFIIKSVIVLISFYLIYWFFLRNESYHTLNRVFLIFSLLATAVFPLIRFSVSDTSPELVGNIFEPLVIGESGLQTPNITESKSISILSIIYISGAVFFCLRFVSNLARLYYLYFRFPKYKYHGFRAVVLDSDQSPFTFFQVLFISRNDFEDGKTKELIIHEQAHRDQFHSLDTILLELMTIVQWFNPFIWLFRNSLKLEHEFIADDKVLREGFNKAKYSKLLVEKSLGINSLNFCTGFNHSLLKKRLHMITHKKSSSLRKLKYLVSIPVIMITMMLLVVNLNSFGQTDDKVYTEGVDIMAQYKGGNIGEVRHYIAENITYPGSARASNISAKIYVQFVIDQKGEVTDVQIARSDILDNLGKEIIVKGYRAETNSEINPDAVKDLEKEAVRVIQSITDLTPAEKDGKAVKTQYTFPIIFSLDKQN